MFFDKKTPEASDASRPPFNPAPRAPKSQHGPLVEEIDTENHPSTIKAGLTKSSFGPGVAGDADEWLRNLLTLGPVSGDMGDQATDETGAAPNSGGIDEAETRTDSQSGRNTEPMSSDFHNPVLTIQPAPFSASVIDNPALTIYNLTLTTDAPSLNNSGAMSTGSTSPVPPNGYDMGQNSSNAASSISQPTQTTMNMATNEPGAAPLDGDREQDGPHHITASPSTRVVKEFLLNKGGVGDENEKIDQVDPPTPIDPYAVRYDLATSDEERATILDELDALHPPSGYTGPTKMGMHFTAAGGLYGIATLYGQVTAAELWRAVNLEPTDQPAAAAAYKAAWLGRTPA